MQPERKLSRGPKNQERNDGLRTLQGPESNGLYNGGKMNIIEITRLTGLKKNFKILSQVQRNSVINCDFF